MVRAFRRIRLTRPRVKEHLTRVSLVYLWLGAIFFLGGVGTILWSLRAANPQMVGLKWLELRKLGPAASDGWRFFHPRWKDANMWSFLSGNGSNSDKRLAQSYAPLHNIINDPKGRIEAEFKTHQSLIDPILFWIDIYARYDSQMRLIHDRDDLRIVYGHLDLRPIFRAHGSAVMRDKLIRKAERDVVTKLQALISEASRAENPLGPPPEETKEMRSYLQNLGVWQRRQELAKQVRVQTGQRDMFELAILRSRELLPHMENVFREAGLPVFLARIPFVESSFNPRAFSKVGAKGLWQFMNATARQMIHPSNVDMWMDPVLQTKAAARLLKMYRPLLPDWPTTITAYNSGVGNLAKLVKQHRAKNYYELVAKMKEEGLGFAGKNFFPEVTAANLVEAYKEEIFTLDAAPHEVGRIFDGLSPFDNEICSVEGAAEGVSVERHR